MRFVILFLISIVCTLLLMNYVCEINDNSNNDNNNWDQLLANHGDPNDIMAVVYSTVNDLHEQTIPYKNKIRKKFIEPMDHFMFS